MFTRTLRHYTFINVIPYLIDLDAAQDSDRKKMAQKLVKIIIIISLKIFIIY